MGNENENQDQPIVGFAKFINENQGGRVNDTLSMELKKVIAATQRFRTAGALVVTIGIKPILQGENEVEMIVKYDSKIPKKNFIKSVMFVDKNFQLTAEDPDQMSLFEQKTVLFNQETGEVIDDQFNNK